MSPRSFRGSFFFCLRCRFQIGGIDYTDLKIGASITLVVQDFFFRFQHFHKSGIIQMIITDFLSLVDQ
jgi:hypothetical protein